MSAPSPHRTRCWRAYCPCCRRRGISDKMPDRHAAPCAQLSVCDKVRSRIVLIGEKAWRSGAPHCASPIPNCAPLRHYAVACSPPVYHGDGFESMCVCMCVSVCVSVLLCVLVCCCVFVCECLCSRFCSVSLAGKSVRAQRVVVPVYYLRHNALGTNAIP